MSTDDNIPSAFTLRYTLRGHTQIITRITWSPNGRILASPSGDQTIRLWDVQTEQPLQTLTGYSGGVLSVAWSPDGKTLASDFANQTICLWDVQTGKSRQILVGHTLSVLSVAWSPDGKTLASGSADETIRLWDVQTGQTLYTLIGHQGSIFSVAWSPDSKTLASGSADETIRLWDVQTGQTLHTLIGHPPSPYELNSGWLGADRDDRLHVYSVAWSPNGRVVASGSRDKTIKIWDPGTGQLINVLEGHTKAVSCVSFSWDGQFLSSKSFDATVRIWRAAPWETVAISTEPSSSSWLSGLAFHPNAPLLATLGENDNVIRIWHLEATTLLGTVPAVSSVHYTNAKIVLVGDSGVGKSGLSLVLTGQPFVATEFNAWSSCVGIREL